jgi:hypothetical protein
MQGSKNLAVMFLFGAVLVGGALGFTADRVLIRDQICPTGSGSLGERLALSPEQKVKVDTILDERFRQQDILLAPIRPTLDSLKLHAREQIRQVLTPEQRQRFEALIAEMNDSTRKSSR